MQQIFFDPETRFIKSKNENKTKTLKDAAGILGPRSAS